MGRALAAEPSGHDEGGPRSESAGTPSVPQPPNLGMQQVVAQMPDITLPEPKAELQTDLSLATLCVALQRLRLTFETKVLIALERMRADVAERREQLRFEPPHPNPGTALFSSRALYFSTGIGSRHARLGRESASIRRHTSPRPLAGEPSGRGLLAEIGVEHGARLQGVKAPSLTGSPKKRDGRQEGKWKV